ncbi:ribosome biogenesis protein NOP53-like isoform X2 [Littorina saxatilis]|uniref:ribosome biogenesis protein NOP53-like isoform X2 n=1 Tax=Littorina saxatilis TaxID=31220 RepID=UPI0038B58DE1
MDEPTFSKRRKLARNKKKSWRGIDISATEEFLEDQRFQLRTTGLVAEKTDDQLFIVERTVKDKSAESVATRRKAKTELKCYSNLANSSRIQCPRKEYPVASNFESKAVHREVCSARATRRKPAPQKADTTTQQTATAQDLWGEEKKETADVEEHFMQVTKRTRVQTPKHVRRKASARPAVEVPHPGSSINPAYDDHQDLLLKAYVVEQKKDKAERKIFNALDARFPCVSEAPTQASWLAEMSGGLFDSEHPSKEEEEGDITKPISINPPVNREKKKTPSERKKAKAAKLLGQHMQQQKKVKGRENKVFSIIKIRSELARETREMKKNAVLKAEKQENKKYAPKKLGKFKVDEPEMELKLSSELVPNLRSVKPEGNLLEDRYRSMMLSLLLSLCVCSRKGICWKTATGLCR